MNLLIIGPTNLTSKIVIKDALEKGHHVTVFVRKPVVGIAHPNLKIARGDVLDYAALDAAMPGHDVVIELLDLDHNEPSTMLSDSTAIIISAMKKNNVKRLICLSSAGIMDNDATFFFSKFIVPMFMKEIFADKKRQMKIIEESGIEWTLIRSTPIVERRKSDKIEVTFDKPTHGRIFVGDLSEFIISIVEEKKYINQMPIVSN